MSEVRYTPYGWQRSVKNGRLVVDSSGHKIATAANRPNAPEAWENAKLMEAAPDMYEALEAIAGNHDAGPGIDAEELCELMTQRARAVLEKIGSLFYQESDDESKNYNA